MRRQNLSGRSTSVYLAFFGFIILVVGLIVCWVSGNSQSSFDSSYSALSGASVELLIGALVSVAGALFLLLGLFSATRRRGPYY